MAAELGETLSKRHDEASLRETRTKRVLELSVPTQCLAGTPRNHLLIQ